MSRYTLFSSLCTFLCLFLCRYTKAGAPAAESPQANTALICHTSHASECYPAIFQPTEYFQRIHDDQSIPPGLHVRLDLTTGLKEARLNVPEPDDAPKADLVLIDNPPEDQRNGEQAPLLPDDSNGQDIEPERQEWRILAPFIPGFDDPPVSYDGSDESNFQRAKEAVLGSRNTQSMLSAIDVLTELAHDLEWGVTLTHDEVLSRTLLDYINSVPPNSAHTTSTPVEIKSASAQLVGIALQNNAEALKAFSSHFNHTAGSWNVQRPPIMAVRDALQDALTPREHDIVLQKRLLFLLANLSPSSEQLELFVKYHGLDINHLLEVFEATEINPSVDGRDAIRWKIANYLQDYIIPNIDSWPKHSLLDVMPPGTSYEIFQSRLVWRRAIRDIGPWCQTLQLAIDKYERVIEATLGLSKAVDNAHTSMSEAYSMLDKVLQKQGCTGGCECDVEKTFASTKYEERDLCRIGQNEVDNNCLTMEVSPFLLK